MVIEEAIYSYLSGYAGLTALVGDRIYPLRAPQKPTFPYVVFMRVGGQSFHTFGIDPGSAKSRFRFYCHGENVESGKHGYQQAGEVADQLIAAFKDQSGIWGGTGGLNIGGVVSAGIYDDFDEETEYYAVIRDYYIWHDE